MKWKTHLKVFLEMKNIYTVFNHENMLISFKWHYNNIRKFGVSQIFKEVNILFSKDSFKLIKHDNKDLYNVIKKNIFQINAILFNFIFIKESSITVST